jgi:hypothetical protein
VALLVVLLFLMQPSSISTTAAVPTTPVTSVKKNAEYYSIVPAEFYDKIDHYEFIYMYNLIFGAVDLGDEPCNIIYQNCILNSDNNNHMSHNVNLHASADFTAATATASTITAVSTQCFPLKKAKYCLHRANFVDSDCVYNRRVQEKARVYHSHLYKNLEACVDRFPVSRGANSGSGSDTSYSQQVNSAVQGRGLLLLVNKIQIFLIATLLIVVCSIA